MKKKLIFLIGSICIGLFVLDACYYDNEQELYPGACDTSVTTYEAAVLPIIVDNCYGCHSASANLGGVNIEGYEALSPYLEDGSFACSVNWDAGCSPMPKNLSQLSSCNLTIINAWIEGGALDN